MIKHLKTVLNAWYWCAFGKKIRNHNSFFFEKYTVHSCIVPFDFMLFYFKHVFLFSIYNFGKKKNFKIIFRITGNRSIEISFIFGTFRSKQKNDKVSQFFFNFFVEGKKNFDEGKKMKCSTPGFREISL